VWQLIKGVLVVFGLLVPLYMVVVFIIALPIERLIGRMLPWRVKWFLTSVVQGFLCSVIFFAVLGFFGASGMSRMQRHPVYFVFTIAVGTVAFLLLNLRLGEFPR
jgi:hypothetical protein